jgi:Lsr2
MAKATVEVLIDDLDGSEGAATVTLGWNGDWRELDLSKRNLAALARTLDRYWKVGRPVPGERQPPTRRRRRTKASSSRSAKAKRDPNLIRAWAIENGIAVPARGRIPVDVERQYNEATGRS